MRTPPHSIAALIPAALVFTAALSTASAQDSAESEADTPVVNDTPIEAGLEQQTLLQISVGLAVNSEW